MPIEDIKQPEGDEEELLLTDTVEGDEGADTIEAGNANEPIDEIDYDSLDDEPADPANDTPLIKQLREQLKQSNREKAELRKQVAPAPIVRTPEPQFEDFDFDDQKYKAAVLAWDENERKANEQERARTAEQQQAAQTWQQELQAYKTKAIQLAKPDFDAAEAAVVTTFSDPQQVIIVKAAKDPARFIYALGRSPQRLAQLAQITDPIKLAAEVARIEGGRVMARKTPANIDTPTTGTARLSTETGDKKEDALIKEAQRTGDINKLRAYRKEQKAKAA